MGEDRSLVPRTESGVVSRVHANLGLVEKQQIDGMIRNASMHLYFHLAVKIIVSFLVMVIALRWFRNIAGDIEHMRQVYLDLEKAEVQKCREDYFENQCDHEKILPALEGFCKDRKNCMEKEIRGKPASMVAVEYFTKLLNEMIEPLSGKVLVVLAVGLGIVLYFRQLG
jgi:hypothetical protein